MTTNSQDSKMPEQVIDRETCWNCGGEGYSHHDCGEDCCCCAHPTPNIKCDICYGEGYLEHKMPEQDPLVKALRELTERIVSSFNGTRFLKVTSKDCHTPLLAAARIEEYAKLIEEHNHRMSLIPSVERPTDPTDGMFVLANWFDAYYREYGCLNAQPQKDLRDWGLLFRDFQSQLAEEREFAQSEYRRLKGLLGESESQLAALKEQADIWDWYCENQIYISESRYSDGIAMSYDATRRGGLFLDDGDRFDPLTGFSASVIDLRKRVLAALAGGNDGGGNAGNS